jgi:hypothetical protein
MLREGNWIDPHGKVHELGGRLTHEQFAQEWLAKRKIKPSQAARNAAKASSFSRTDAGPAFFELLRQGWVRQRGCDFTVWRFDGPTALSIAIGAHHLWCPQIIAEACNERGCRSVRQWRSVTEMGEEFNGLRRRRRTRKR